MTSTTTEGNHSYVVLHITDYFHIFVDYFMKIIFHSKYCHRLSICLALIVDDF